MFSALFDVFVVCSMLILFVVAVYLFYIAILECVWEYFIYGAGLDLLICNGLFKENTTYCSMAVYISLAVIAAIACICFGIQKRKSNHKNVN